MVANRFLHLMAFGSKTQLDSLTHGKAGVFAENLQVAHQIARQAFAPQSRRNLQIERQHDTAFLDHAKARIGFLLQPEQIGGDRLVETGHSHQAIILNMRRERVARLPIE